MTSSSRRVAADVAAKYRDRGTGPMQRGHLTVRSRSSLESIASAIDPSQDLDGVLRIVRAALNGNQRALAWARSAPRSNLAVVARVLCLAGGENDLDAGISILKLLVNTHGASKIGMSYRRIYLDSLIYRQRFDEALSFLEVTSFPSEFDIPYRIAIGNPFRPESATKVARAEWEDLLNSFMSPSGELSRVCVRDDLDGLPYDRLYSESQKALSGPLVTVVMSSYQRGEMMFRAIDSILNQTWRSLELLVVDDDSGPGYDDLYDKVANLDPRIRVVRQRVNGGTYLARNRAMNLARGEFITFQDSDDWSHPERIERQIQPMLADDNIYATQSYCVRTDDFLDPIAIGYPKHLRRNESSLMFRRSVVNEVGYFHYTRKAGDSEYRLRMETALDTLTHMVHEEPLAIVRLTPGSLSRNEFKPGYRHPTRFLYSQAFQLEHQRALETADFYKGHHEYKDNYVPATFQPRRSDVSDQTLDVIVADDLRDISPSYAWTVACVRQLHAQGLRVGIAHWAGIHNVAARGEALDQTVTELLVDGLAVPVNFGERRKCKSVIVSDAALLHHVPWGSTGWLANHVYARVLPAGLQDGGLVDYATAANNSKKLFSVQPKWIETQNSKGILLGARLSAVETLPTKGDSNPILEEIYPGTDPTCEYPVWGTIAISPPAVSGWHQGGSVFRGDTRSPSSVAFADGKYCAILGRAVQLGASMAEERSIVRQLLEAWERGEAEFEQVYAGLGGQFIFARYSGGKLSLRSVGVRVHGRVDAGGVKIRCGRPRNASEHVIVADSREESVIRQDGRISKYAVPAALIDNECPVEDQLQLAINEEIEHLVDLRPWVYLRDDLESIVTLGLIREKLESVRIEVDRSAKKIVDFLRGQFVEFAVRDRPPVVRADVHLVFGPLASAGNIRGVHRLCDSLRNRALYESSVEINGVVALVRMLWPGLESLVSDEPTADSPASQASVSGSSRRGVRYLEPGVQDGRIVEQLRLPRRKRNHIGIAGDLSQFELLPLSAVFIRGRSERLIVNVESTCRREKDSQYPLPNTIRGVFPCHNLTIVDTTPNQFGWFFGLPGDNLARRYSSLIKRLAARLGAQNVVVIGEGVSALPAVLLGSYLEGAQVVVSGLESVAGESCIDEMDNLSVRFGESYTSDVLLREYPERLTLEGILSSSERGSFSIVECDVDETSTGARNSVLASGNSDSVTFRGPVSEWLKTEKESGHIDVGEKSRDMG